MTRGWSGIVAGLLLLGSGCAGGRSDDVEPVANPVRVEVINNYALPMEVYASGSGVRHRLGMVHPGMTGNFALPPALSSTGPVEFEALPSATGPRFRSEPLLLSAGQVVDLIITAQLFNSTATVRP